MRRGWFTEPQAGPVVDYSEDLGDGAVTPKMKLAAVLALSLALALGTASAADSVLVFNEVHYHPANEAAQTEWIELRSLQSVDVDISGWRIEGGIDYTFPAGTIMPGG